MVAAINDAAAGRIDAPNGWLEAKWDHMTHDAKLVWVGRRRAVLWIVWVRGGNDGFAGLGARLSEALEDIDH